jgi:predicted anti-sigma-YlaC factor YlaD
LNKFVCHETRALANAYVDDELTVGTSLRIVNHLLACEGCAQYLDEILLVKERLRRARMTLPQPDLAARVRNRIRSDAQE